jgi:NADPH:quinone reductase-like Zn-dependent oxidoreductase
MAQMTATAQAAAMDEVNHEAVRAVVQTGYGGAEVLQLAAIERPRPGPREVLVQVRAAGLDRGTWHLMTGRPYLVRLVIGLVRPKQPVLGLDVAGTVVAVGAEVTRFKPGDEVFGIGRGSFAELTVAREDKLAHKPAGLSFAQAAVSGVSALTALQALEAGRFTKGERVLIIGASGGVGTFAVQLARLLGAEVTAVCSTSKVELVRSLGAAHVLDYTTTDFTQQGTYDLILDIAGNTRLAKLRRILTPTGRLVFVGGENGGDYTAGFGRQLYALLLAPFVKQRFLPFMAKEHYTDLERLARWLEAGSLRPVIDRECPLQDVAQAMRDLEDGRVRGKVAVVVA